jgi:hypothetical protein
MCGRYRLSRRKQIIAEHFDAPPFDDTVAAPQHCSHAAGSSATSTSQRPPRVLSLMRWILIPPTPHPVFTCVESKVDVGGSKGVSGGPVGTPGPVSRWTCVFSIVTSWLKYCNRSSPKTVG